MLQHLSFLLLGMPRELRQRAKRPNYAVLSGYNSDDIEEDDGDASSNGFVPPVEVDQEVNEDSSSNDADEDDGKVNDIGSDNRNEEGPEYLKLSNVKRGKTKPSPQAAASTSAPSLSVPLARAGSSRTHYALPIPPTDHRYRSSPLYRTSLPVERLASPPRPCAPAETVYTNNWTSDSTITDRFNKASSYNAGAGPVWEMMEDRSWWKESLSVQPEGSEASRRPRLYQDIKADTDITILDRKYALIRYVSRND